MTELAITVETHEENATSHTETVPFADDYMGAPIGNVREPATPTERNANDASAPSPLITFKAFIKRVLEFPREQVLAAYTNIDRGNDSATDKALPSSEYQ